MTKGKYKVGLVTTSRADYGVQKPLIQALFEDPEIELALLVSGSHLAPEFGYTLKEIQGDGFPVAQTFDVLLSGDSQAAMAKAQGLSLISFADYFAKADLDFLFLLGDRFEMAAVALCALNFKIPMGHLHGGEVTKGAVDDALRHAITKCSYLHFASSRDYAQRIIQLGEDPHRVFNVGAMGVENIKNLKELDFSELAQSIGLDETKPYALVTYHPVTLGGDSVAMVAQMLEAFRQEPGLNYIFTYANADAQGRQINQAINAFIEEVPGSLAFQSLGYVRYLNLMKHAQMVIGNSSSGIIETPAFGLPTVNIGSRQDGRTRAGTIIDCGEDQAAIQEAIAKAMDPDFRAICMASPNPFGQGDTSGKIMAILKDWLPRVSRPDFSLAKGFYDLPRRMS